MVAPLFPLSASGVEVRRQGRRLIGPVDLALEGQGVTMLMGPNGAGKTTLLRALHGLERLAAGTIAWAAPRAEAVRRQAFVFQTPIILRRSVIDNVAYPLRLRGAARGAARARAAVWIERIGLSDRAHIPATRLSGGEKQKLALARALILEPEALFLDEPCASLDGGATKDIEALLQGESDRGTRIIMSTHNLGQARRLADDVIFMVGGRVVERAPAPAFFSSPQTPQARAFQNGEIVQ